MHQRERLFAGPAIADDIRTPALIPERLRGDEPIAEGVRRMLRRLFERMLAREASIHYGEDPEDVHRMRVAARRLRASLQVVEPVYDRRAIRRFRHGLRQIAQALGDVRDLDVFMQHVLEYRTTVSESESRALALLIAAIGRGRTDARAALLAELDTQRYQAFKHSFTWFLTTPHACVSRPSKPGLPARVRDNAGSMIWRRYEQWRVYEVALLDPTATLLHQARIAGKYLRYTIELFADALGPQVEGLLTPLIVLQETLGSLQDGVVADTYIHALGLDDDPGAQAYLVARQSEQSALLAELPEQWAQVASASYRRRLLVVIAGL